MAIPIVTDMMKIDIHANAGWEGFSGRMPVPLSRLISSALLLTGHFVGPAPGRSRMSPGLPEPTVVFVRELR
jgi:hypothetical protein